MGAVFSSCGCGDGLSALLGGGAKRRQTGKGVVDAAPDGVVEAQFQRPRAGSWTSPLPKAQLQRLASPGGADFEWCEEAFSLDAQPAGGSTPAAAKASIAADPDARGRRVAEASFASPGDPRAHFLTEQLFASPGALPKAASSTDRQLRELRNTATHEMLKKLPKHLVEATGPDGQALRRRLLNGATVVFFTAGYPGKRFIFERAREMGVKSVIIEHPDSWARALVDEGVIAKFIPIDMSQDAAIVFQQTLDAIRALANDPLTREADGVVTFCELSVPVVARLTEILQLPGHSPLSVDKARDKHWTRAEMKKAGLPSPKNSLIKCEADLQAVASEVGFPAVLKPISGAASLGVKKVTGWEDLQTSYREVITELNSLVVSSGSLVKNDGSGTGVDANKVMDCTILMEQYLDGSEVDVDVVMSDGDWRYAAVTDNGPTLEPYFNETWAVCPSVLPSASQKILKDLAIATLKCLGFQDGIFHVELKLTTHGPQLIEVNARMGGGQVHETNLRVWGIDLVEETLFCGVGIPCRPYIPSREPPGGAVAYCDINATRSGTLQSLDFLKPLNGKEGIVWAKPYIQAGTKVVGPQDGLPTWLAEIVVQKSNAQEALDYLFELQNSLDPPIV
eukprot:CAMPEP_0183395826 /NCGR_PEP_ID=MMETSP0370-20130417/9595_1 /TAXON_ID=268820 /ORGANISM="Peridinium aciculiferum, Strain PAER-2" /LENGTH=622 /DNA_ID=CAMNT_0025576515 /DNA_START=51 /DNA_END=1919 /DNA_ORIENTATION=+